MEKLIIPWNHLIICKYQQSLHKTMLKGNCRVTKAKKLVKNGEVRMVTTIYDKGYIKAYIENKIMQPLELKNSDELIDLIKDLFDEINA
jgi:hypothetical protein